MIDLDETESEDVLRFTELIVKECINAIQNIDRHHAHTTYDLGLIEQTIAKCKEKLINHFGL